MKADSFLGDGSLSVTLTIFCKANGRMEDGEKTARTAGFYSPAVKVHDETLNWRLPLAGARQKNHEMMESSGSIVRTFVHLSERHSFARTSRDKLFLFPAVRDRASC